jgi:hypothetical protein
LSSLVVACPGLSSLCPRLSSLCPRLSSLIATTGGKAPSTTLRHAAIAAFHQVEAFLLSLTDARDDGRVILSVEESATKPGVTMRYILLNPAERFRDVVEQARSVVLAGGTMEPVSGCGLCQSINPLISSRSATFSASSFLLSHAIASPRYHAHMSSPDPTSSRRSSRRVHESNLSNSSTRIGTTSLW